MEDSARTRSPSPKYTLHTDNKKKTNRSCPTGGGTERSNGAVVETRRLAGESRESAVQSLAAKPAKTASMDIFDVLLFDYKVKTELATSQMKPSVLRDFLEGVNALNFQLQDITVKYVSDNGSKVSEELVELEDEGNQLIAPDDNLSELSCSAAQDQETDLSEISLQAEEVPQWCSARKRGHLKRSCNANPANSTAEQGTKNVRNVVKSTRNNNKASCCEWQCNMCKRLTLHMSLVHQQEVQLDEVTECAMFCDRSTAAPVKDEYDIELDRASLDAEDEAVRHGVERLLRSWEQLCSLKSLICGQCMEEYRSLRRMVHHLPRCKPGPYKCELCPQEFKNKRELNYHKKKMHVNEKSFFCEECGLAFKLRTSLQKHLVKRHETKQGPYPCLDCNITFSKKIHLTNHRDKKHNLEKNFLCQVCGNKFCTQSSLMAHLETHTGQKRFTCSYCCRSFLKKEKLIFHTRTHTGERPFECALCHKKFIRKSKLDEHERRHAGEKRKQHANKADKEDTSASQDDSADSKAEEMLETATLVESATPQMLSNIATAPTIVAVESLQISTLEGSTATQFLLPAAPTLQIQVPISVAHSYNLTNQQGQQILLTGLNNFDMSGNLPF
ncbi:hypothetical protein B566_EDAN007479 [Ephemera danica]|nr:hypothetical protein B566_EDAN007479 [Ephemera danica]